MEPMGIHYTLKAAATSGSGLALQGLRASMLLGV